MDMLCVMAGADKKGYLMVGGKALSEKEIAKISRISEKKCKKILLELKTNRVFSISNDGIIYCRRMVRDSEISRKSAEYGKRGGNPNLTKGLTPPLNPKNETGVKHQEAEAEAEAIEEKKLEKKEPNGTRLPADWQPGEKEFEIAAEYGMPMPATADDFRDYWTAKVGKDARKKDWTATFRRWCRNGFGKPGRPVARPAQKTHPLEEQAERMRQRFLGEGQ